MSINFVKRYTNKDIFSYLTSVYGKRYLSYRNDWQRSAKGEFLPEFPLCLNYELTDSCNLKCVHCERSVRKGKNRGRLGFDLFKRTIDEGAKNGLPSLKLGFGEPFLEKQIFEQVKYARSKGVMDIIVTTNGTLINERNIDQILMSGITFLRISVDALTDETYTKVRGAKLGKLENIIKMLVVRRKELKREIPLIRLSFVKMPLNEHEIEAFRSKWLDIVDYIDFQDYIDPNHLFENMEPQAAVKSDFFCPYPWQMVPIMGNGDIRVCCSWYGENLLLGNVKEMSIKKAWDLPFMNEIRKMVATRVYEKDCARCVNARENVKFFSQEQSSEI